MEKAIDTHPWGPQGHQRDRRAGSPLEKYGSDLTERAREGKLDPVIGRDSGDPTGRPGALAPHQEQPGPHR